MDLFLRFMIIWGVSREISIIGNNWDVVFHFDLKTNSEFLSQELLVTLDIFKLPKKKQKKNKQISNWKIIRNAKK